MALGTVAWGPASITANTDTPTPALTIDPACNSVLATADFSALAAGFAWSVKIQYRKTSTDPTWRDFGGSSGVTIGGPDHDRHGNVVETGVQSGPFPDPGVTGRQVRAVCNLATSATLSGHVTTS